MVKDCKQIATHSVVLEARNHPAHSPATAEMVVVCDAHKDLKWEDVIDDKGWKVITSSFVERGYAAPSRKHSRIVIVPINQGKTQ